MSAGQQRGGFPEVRRYEVPAAGGRFELRAYCTYLRITTDAALRVYFTEEDFDGDRNYVVVSPPAAATPHAFEGPYEVQRLWMRGDGGTANVELVTAQRRG